MSDRNVTHGLTNTHTAFGSLSDTIKGNRIFSARIERENTHTPQSGHKNCFNLTRIIFSLWSPSLDDIFLQSARM